MWMSRVTALIWEKRYGNEERKEKVRIAGQRRGEARNREESERTQKDMQRIEQKWMQKHFIEEDGNGTDDDEDSSSEEEGN